ncbi:hypothetical protein V5799_011124 [Amblyomma americanum]|uniref:Uncharacterized protein n=1 Tax=Amblyomma americanum TaxID=6943 RepID=A0AAQ4EHS4_AMBAM
MLAKAVLVLVLFQKNFLRDWHILMKHIFTAEEEEILVRCCAPNQSKALNTCVDKAGLTFKQYKDLKTAVERWRSRGLGRSSPEEEKKELSGVTDPSTSLMDLTKRARALAKCIAEIK